MRTFVEKIYNNIGHASTSNVLKIRDSFRIKEGGNGVCPNDFCNEFIRYCIERAEVGDDSYKIGKAVEITLSLQADLMIKGLRVDSRIDVYLLELKNIFKER